MNIYFSGLGGVGIGPLAEIARDAGHIVIGSDLVDNLVTQELRHQGVIVEIGQDGSFLQAVHAETPIDWFVHTAALSDDHAELALARKLGIKTAKRDELLAFLLKEKDLKLIAVSGTHGKTTTTGMLVWAFQQLSIPVSYSVGSTLSFGPSGKFDPASEYFIYECDEFDRNFLHFSPHLSLITSIDYDHPDTYRTEAEYKAAFRQFIYQSSQTIMWQHDSDYIESRYPNQWSLQDDEVLQLAIPGAHNRRNATLVLKALERLAINENTVNREAIELFPGTDRRFEKLTDNLYTDYGHHPVEIAATLQLAREVSDHVVLVYQPHQNVRQHQIKDEYTTQFELADTVHWLPTYLSREDPGLSILQPADLTTSILNKTKIQFSELNDELWQAIESYLASGKLVLLMGAGSIDGWARTQLATRQ